LLQTFLEDAGGLKRKASVTRLHYLVWLQGMQHDDSSRLQVFTLGSVLYLTAQLYNSERS